MAKASSSGGASTSRAPRPSTSHAASSTTVINLDDDGLDNVDWEKLADEDDKE